MAVPIQDNNYSQERKKLKTSWVLLTLSLLISRLKIIRTWTFKAPTKNQIRYNSERTLRILTLCKSKVE